MTDQWQPATLLRRYKRFLADVELPGGEQITVHCPNTGAMTGCMETGARIWLSQSDNPKRKYAMTWEAIELSSGATICIHSAHANRVVEQALAGGLIPELANYRRRQREVKLGQGSRVDFVLTDPGCCVLEVKSVTLALSEGVGAFPDAVSTRASRHLRELIDVVARGDRAVLLLLAMHTGIKRIAPADAIDPAYGETLRSAISAGVEVLCYSCDVSRKGAQLSRALPFLDSLPADLLP